jgi:hypothetical protein
VSTEVTEQGGGETTTTQAGAEQASEGQGGEAAAGQVQTDQLAPVLERLNELGGQLGEVRPLLEQLRPQEQQQAQAEPEGFDGLVDAEGYLDVDALNKRMESMVEQRLNTALAGDREQLQHVQNWLLDQEFEQLEQEYPDLQDEQKANALMQSVKKFAADRGIPGLAQDPEFVEQFYLAERARELGRAQQAAGSATGQEVSLEGGSGANQQPAQSSDDDIRAGIRNSGPSGSVWGR